MNAVETASRHVEPKQLPRLRAELQIELLTDGQGGFPSVVVTDPMRNSYFQLAWPDSAILLHWQAAGTTEALRQLLASTYGLDVTADEVAAVAQFALGNDLLELEAAGAWRRYPAQHAASKHGWLKTAIHGYLFFRLPLLRPQRALEKLLPLFSFAFRPLFWLVLAGAAMYGLHLASRQWTALVAATHDALRLDGLAIYAVAIFFLKGVHELGHALTTVRLGCRVPSMGIAVMLGAPVLYTDTSDSWRLGRKSDRLKIVFAGVAAELIVATAAILAWPALGDGVMRQICFAIATSSIALSIAINLNPFMRYDGYFALSDFLGIPNLQNRSFDLGLWKLREMLFGLGHEPPEHFSSGMRRTLIIYAFCTAIYRLMLYIGIAAIVYMMAGKAIGIVLGLFEIAIFIALPVAREMGRWWELRSEIAMCPRAWTTAAATAAFLAACFVPWVPSVGGPALMTAMQEEAVYLPLPARVVSIEVVEGQAVRAGDILVRAHAPDLDRQLRKAHLEERVLTMQSGRLLVSDKERQDRIVIENKLQRARDKIVALTRQSEQLIVKAPFDGLVKDLDPDLAAGQWGNQRRPLARVVSESGARVKGLVGVADIDRIAAGTNAVFIPDDAKSPRVPLHAAVIAPASDGRLQEPVLAERHGGSIQASEERGELLTRQGWFEVSFDVPSVSLPQVARGVVHIDAERTSLMALMWNQFGRVLVREQGF